MVTDFNGMSCTLHIPDAGRRFAEQEIYTHALKLLAKYRVEREGTDTLQQEYHMLMRPKTEAKLKFIQR